MIIEPGGYTLQDYLKCEMCIRDRSIGVEMSELDYALTSHSEHKKIYAALEARDALAARAEMEKHILRSMDDALTYYL